MFHFTPLLHDQLHHVPDIFVRAHDKTFYDRLPDFFDYARIRQKGGIIDINRLTVGLHHVIDHAGIGRDDVHVEFATEPLLDNLHMEQTKKTASASVP